ncbi:MAG: hypothetical protein IT281_02975 [Ignavibacteria bacterium]|nr:hypothetical protein [Ignavibacteria bacterium]
MLKNLKILILIAFIITAYSGAQDGFLLQEGTTVKPVGKNRGKELLITEDAYTNVLSKFDVQSKTLDPSKTTVKDYLDFAGEQAEDWTSNEKKIIEEVISSVAGKIKTLGLKLSMPAEIELIKSTMKNEGGADGYTRGDYIVLKDSWLSSKSVRLEDLFIHELFHVLSRHNPSMSEKIYNSIGFKKCNEVEYPNEIKDLRISNPDAPLNNFYLTVQYDGKPIDIMLVLYSADKYTNGSFFSYLQVGLMVVEGDENSKKPVYKEGEPLILKFKDVKNFFEQAGKNTGYVIHAEEISADHFVMLLNQTKELPNPELIEAMKKIMTE